MRWKIQGRKTQITLPKINCSSRSRFGRQKSLERSRTGHQNDQVQNGKILLSDRSSLPTLWVIWAFRSIFSNTSHSQIESWVERGKTTLQKTYACSWLLRTHLTRHFFLSSGQRERSVIFDQLAESQKPFLPSIELKRKQSQGWRLDRSPISLPFCLYFHDSEHFRVLIQNLVK